ncbi:hypothetical protein TRIUR3_17626 [Triticum urartu]|uniref:Uncharacterized protein n=1 Tax=Triticum urartu TaxID=4572 RepID=M7Z2M8_TRIUA|nr:hypothetical protein TRIUR3_17626 [Triticum urartu]
MEVARIWTSCCSYCFRSRYHSLFFRLQLHMFGMCPYMRYGVLDMKQTVQVNKGSLAPRRSGRGVRLGQREDRRGPQRAKERIESERRHSAVSWSKSPVRMWFNIKGKAQDFHADNDATTQERSLKRNIDHVRRSGNEFDVSRLTKAQDYRTLNKNAGSSIHAGYHTPFPVPDPVVELDADFKVSRYCLVASKQMVGRFLTVWVPGASFADVYADMINLIYMHTLMSIGDKSSLIVWGASHNYYV